MHFKCMIAGIMVACVMCVSSSAFALGNEFTLLRVPKAKIFENTGEKVIMHDDWKVYQNLTRRIVVIIPNDTDKLPYLFDGVGRQFIRISRKGIQKETAHKKNYIIVSLKTPSWVIGGVPFFSEALAVGTSKSPKSPKNVVIFNVQLK